jgi:hypothetical protein
MHTPALHLPDFERTISQGVEKDLISLYRHPFLMTRQDLLAVLLRRYTRARVVVRNGRSAAIKAFQRVIDLPYVVPHLLMRADVPQENFRAGA